MYSEKEKLKEDIMWMINNQINDFKQRSDKHLNAMKEHSKRLNNKAYLLFNLGEYEK